MQILFFIFMFILGAVFGSFLCCQARRLYVREGKGEKPRTNSHAHSVAKSHTCIPPKTSRASKAQKALPVRSICLHCKKRLKWHDNIPILSWLILKGKCRHCHEKIGLAEILSEILTAIAFLLLATTINVETADIYLWLRFALMVILSVFLIFAAIYDGLYGEMPTFLLTFSIICAILIVILQAGHSFLVAGFFDDTTLASIIQPLAAGALYGGLYLILYLVSKGKWVGDGDWLIGLASGLALGYPWLALVALFLANSSACFVMLPIINHQSNSPKSPQKSKQSQKTKKSQNLTASPARATVPHQIYFAPFMVFAFIITYALSDFISGIL